MWSRHSNLAGDEKGRVASTTNITRALRSLAPLLETSIGVSGPCPVMNWPADNVADAVRSLLAELPRQDIESFTTRMRMYLRPGAGWPASIVDAQQILWRTDWR
jgi:hypothetical protein